MVGLYTEGSRPIQATGLLEEASYRVLGQKHALSVRDSLSAASASQRQEGWRHHPYPSGGSRQGRDQGKIWGTHGEYAMLITIRNMGARVAQ